MTAPLLKAAWVFTFAAAVHREGVQRFLIYCLGSGSGSGQSLVIPGVTERSLGSAVACEPPQRGCEWPAGAVSCGDSEGKPCDLYPLAQAFHFPPSLMNVWSSCKAILYSPLSVRICHLLLSLIRVVRTHDAGFQCSLAAMMPKEHLNCPH